jgi:hypothetical protein
MSDTPRNDHHATDRSGDHESDGAADHPPDRPTDHPSDEQLRAHLDGTLGPAEDTEVAGHLDGCAACTGRLDAFEEPPVLAAAGPSPAAGAVSDADLPAWDERRMRRSVRRTLLRTAWNTALLLVAVAIALQLLGWFVLQPLLVARGDRLADSVVATIDVPIMTIPGAELAQVRSNPGVLRRTTEASFERFVGARPVELGWLTTRLGPFGMSTPHTAWSSMMYGSLHGPDGSRVGPVDQSPVPFEPDRLAAGTAVTVEVGWDLPVARTQAQAVTGGSDEVALSWVGFEVPGTRRELGDPPLGYSACGTILPSLQEMSSGLGGFGAAGGFRGWAAPGNGVEHALTELRRATANLADSGWGDGSSGEGPLADPAATAAALASGDPQVASLVVTGPLDAVVSVVDAADGDRVELLEIDFDRGAPDPCG